MAEGLSTFSLTFTVMVALFGKIGVYGKNIL